MDPLPAALGRTWANFHGGPGELSTTIEAYWALRLAGDASEAPHMRAAAAFIRSEGGSSARASSLTCGSRCSDSGPGIACLRCPPEIILLPPWVPLNVYDFACWARQTIVALSLVKTHRPVKALPFTLEELHGEHRAATDGPASGEPAPAGRASSRGRMLEMLDRLARAYELRPIGPLRRLAVSRAEHWIVRRQESDGSWEASSRRGCTR